jgi:hypothetical protein
VGDDGLDFRYLGFEGCNFRLLPFDGFGLLLDYFCLLFD